MAPDVDQRRQQRQQLRRQPVVDAGELVAGDLAAAAAGGGIGGGLFAGVLGKSFTLFGQSIPSFGVALQALEHTKDANIISRPHLMTMDNTKATISVGQQIVYQTQSLGSLTTGTTSPSVLNSYARQPVALSRSS